MYKTNYLTLILVVLFASNVHSKTASKATDDFFTQLYTTQVASDNTIIWSQVAPGNAGFANLVRYHPTLPGVVALVPDMWNAYQSNNNGGKWECLKDPDGNGDFYHIRDLYYSSSDANFGLAIESSRLWMTQDMGKNWINVKNCPWYTKDAAGYDTQGWLKKVASLAIDPKDKNIWFVGGGSNVRGQDWLSCYMDVNSTNPNGTTATNEGKLWRTTDAGANWTLVNSGLNAKAQVGRIIVNPTNTQQVFASSNYGIYRSENGGTSWTQISSGKLDNDIIMDMDFYYNASTNKFALYAIDQVQYLPNGTTTKCTGGIYKSSDNGNTWVKINGDLGLDINRLTGGVSASYYKYIALWLNITEAVAKTTYPVLPTQALQYFNMIAVDPSRENALYIGFADPQVGNSIVPGRVWTTSNDGQKWTNTARLYGDIWANDKAYWIARGNPYNENMIVGHESPHMQSGSNYALRSTRGIAVGIDGSVMMISDHSTMLSTDHGETWNQVDEDYTPSGGIVGRGNSNMPALVIGQDKRNSNMVLGSGEHRVWIPVDDSPNDRQAMKFIKSAQESVSCLAYDPYNKDIVYATSQRQAYKQNIFRSIDGGNNWENYGVATPATNTWLDDFYTNGLTIDPINNKYFYFGISDIVNLTKSTMGGFFFSEDYGKTFSQRNNGLPNPSRIKQIIFDPRDNTKASLFVAAEKCTFSQMSPLASGGLYFSADRGLNWTKVNTPASVEGVTDIVMDHTNRMYITTGYRGGGSGVWYTDNYGTNWTQIFTYPGARLIDVSPFDNNLLVVTVEYLAKNPGVFVSRDRGATWVKSNKSIGIPHKIEDIKFNIQDPAEIWSATLGCGFYKGQIENGDKVQVVKTTPTSIDYKNGANRQITASIVQSQFAGQTITWKSDNPAVVTVDQNGYITPKSRGKATVWATTSNGRYSDNCVVVVNEIPSGLILKKSNESISITPTLVGNYFSINGVEDNCEVNIFTLKGEKVLQTTNTQNIDISNLLAGIYCVKVISKNNFNVEKIIKKGNI